MTEARYVLVRNEGIDTLHRSPGEQCNLDDSERDESVDPLTASKLKAGGFVRLCQHCYGNEEEPS